jgi:eukaryotic-like serine/threonine-protein kinase
MAGSNIERDLIYGLVAMRAGLVGRDALIAALADWSLDTSMPLEAIFRDRLRLSDAQRAMLAGLVETHLSTHHTDFAASPAEIDTQDVLRDTLAPAATQYITPPWVTPARQPAATAGASRFRIVRTHAKGGLGEVFIAIDEELHREIALKEIQSHRANHPESQRRFRFEVK